MMHSKKVRAGSFRQRVKLETGSLQSALDYQGPHP